MQSETSSTGEAYKSITFTSCETFRSQERPEATRIYGLTQPRSTRPTSSIHVYIVDSYGNTVAYVDSGVTFEPVTGPLTVVSASLDPTTVSALASFTWTVRPLHGLSAADAPSLTFVLPWDFTVQEECSIAEGSRTCAGDPARNAITVYSLVDEDFAGDEDLTFTVGDAVALLPRTTAGAKGTITVTTYVEGDVAGERYAVDSGEGSQLFQLTAGDLSASVTPNDTHAFLQCDYTFRVTPEHRIPQYGLIMVEYPEEISVEDPSLSQTLCYSWENFPSESAVCAIHDLNRTIIISKGFQAAEGGEGGASEYSWVVPFVTNPATLLTTSSFRITTRDQYFALIDDLASGVTVQMTKAAVLKSASLVLDSYANAASTKYSFTVVATAPVEDGGNILVIFPRQCALPPGEEELECESSSSDLVRRVTCRKYDLEDLPDE